MNVVRHNYIGPHEPGRRRKPDASQEHVHVRICKTRSPVLCADGQKDERRLILDEKDASSRTATLQKRLHNTLLARYFLSAVISTSFIVVRTSGSSSLPHADHRGAVGTGSCRSSPTDLGCCETVSEFLAPIIATISDAHSKKHPPLGGWRC